MEGDNYSYKKLPCGICCMHVHWHESNLGFTNSGGIFKSVIPKHLHIMLLDVSLL